MGIALLLPAAVVHPTRRLQETMLVSFQNQAGQPTSRIRGRVNSDSIAANFRRGRRRVTVHHKLSVLRPAGQERFSDIQQYHRDLADRAARPGLTPA